MPSAGQRAKCQKCGLKGGFSIARSRASGCFPKWRLVTRLLGLVPLAAITERKAGFRSLGDTWADTTTSHGRLMLTVHGGLAEFERDLIRARTGEGRERAKARGVKLGRKPKLTVHQQQEAIKRRDVDGEPIRDIARSYNVHNSTISRLTA
jgi:DNA invertase Pin-like site-specific DNA recombinase